MTKRDCSISDICRDFWLDIRTNIGLPGVSTAIIEIPRYAIRRALTKVMQQVYSISP